MTVFKNAQVVNVFTERIETADVAVENGVIVGVGHYEGDETIDCTGKYLAPGFIDGHIHIESTMLRPAEFARCVLPHGTTAVVADPHEIANVCGTAGLDFMLAATEGLPLDVFFMLPSCVPAAPLDEAGATLTAANLKPYYAHPRVLGLGEMMNFVGVLAQDGDVLQKIEDAKVAGGRVDGHAPGLTGASLDGYLAAGIESDHECSSVSEAMERIQKGQWVMARDGSAAKNLRELMPLFDTPWYQRAMLCTDDRHVGELLEDGHLDATIRRAVAWGADPVRAIKMASYQAALYFGLKRRGAIAPGYLADLVVLDDLQTCAVCATYKGGVRIGKFPDPPCETARVAHSFHLEPMKAEQFKFRSSGQTMRVIGLQKGEILTDSLTMPQPGVDIGRDVVKLAVVERHRGTGHIGLGFVHGYGLRDGAVASSVAHDSHNLIVAGVTDADMAAAANAVRNAGGGWAVAKGGHVVASLALPLGGVMSDVPAATLAADIARMHDVARALGVSEGIDPFMTLAFVSLPVIPTLRLTTTGLVDVLSQQHVNAIER